MTVRAIPAIGFDDLDRDLREALEPRVERLGYLGEFFQRTAHQPEALQAFMQFTEAARSSVPVHLAEVAALSVATALGNDYERHQHERLCVRLGFTPGWVAAVERLDPDAADGDLARDERVAQRYVLAALETAGRGATPALDALAAEVGPEGAVGVLFVVARDVGHAHVANSLGLRPPVPSIFEDTDAG